MKKEIELYIHIPFCVRKCAYCDFLSFAADEETKNSYVAMLLREIEAWKDRGDFQVSTVFFGGGTPSVLPAEQIVRIMETLRSKFVFAEQPEISIECNPGTVDEEKLRIYRQAGINRISFGLQSAQAEELKSLGRIHTYEEFAESFLLARAAGFDNINVDLMSALPGQKLHTWEDTLQKVLALRPEHISAYSLIIEEGTPFYERYAEDAKRRDAGEESFLLPCEEEERRMYYRTEKLLGAAGYERYEISNYALPGRACRHNCGYWERVPYKGFGLGAASLLDNVRFSNTADMKQYLSGAWGSKEPETLDERAQMEETMFLGLRLKRGVSIQTFFETFGMPMMQVYGEVIQKLQSEGLLAVNQSCVCLTKRGVDISNYVLSEFLF